MSLALIWEGGIVPRRHFLMSWVILDCHNWERVEANDAKHPRIYITTTQLSIIWPNMSTVRGGETLPQRSYLVLSLPTLLHPVLQGGPGGCRLEDMHTFAFAFRISWIVSATWGNRVIMGNFGLRQTGFAFFGFARHYLCGLDQVIYPVMSFICKMRRIISMVKINKKLDLKWDYPAWPMIKLNQC